MDLLTVLEHELGHLLGFDHQETGVMEDTLAAGTRKTPAGQWSVQDAAILEFVCAGEPAHHGRLFRDRAGLLIAGPVFCGYTRC